MLFINISQKTYFDLLKFISLFVTTFMPPMPLKPWYFKSKDEVVVWLYSFDVG